MSKILCDLTIKMLKSQRIMNNELKNGNSSHSNQCEGLAGQRPNFIALRGWLYYIPPLPQLMAHSKQPPCHSGPALPRSHPATAHVRLICHTCIHTVKCRLLHRLVVHSIARHEQQEQHPYAASSSSISASPMPASLLGTPASSAVHWVSVVGLVTKRSP